MPRLTRRLYIKAKSDRINTQFVSAVLFTRLTFEADAIPQQAHLSVNCQVHLELMGLQLTVPLLTIQSHARSQMREVSYHFRSI